MPAASDRDRHPYSAAEMAALSDDELVAAIARSEEVRRLGRERSGRLLAELHSRRQLSWPAISRLTGIRQTTAYELAQPYIVPDDGLEQPLT